MRVIDVHTHGIGGYDTRTADPDQILKIAEIQGSYGVSEILLTLYPSTIKEMRENMEVVKKAIREQEGTINHFGRAGVENDRLEAAGQSAKITGLHLEGPFLNPAKCGAMNAAAFIEPTEYAFKELVEGFEDIVKIITIAPEMNGAARLIKRVSDAGFIVSMGHSDATYAEAEAGFHAGARSITHIFNAMRGVHHREPGIAGFGLLNREIYIEIIADPFHLHPKTLELVFRTKNADRIIIISDTVKDTKTGGMVKPLSDAYGKLIGGSMTVVESSERLIKMGHDEVIIMNCVTRNPFEYLSAG